MHSSLVEVQHLKRKEHPKTKSIVFSTKKSPKTVIYGFLNGLLNKFGKIAYLTLSEPIESSHRCHIGIMGRIIG